MLTKSEIIHIISNKLPYLNIEFGVNKIGLFGSFAKENQSEKSDIDIVAKFNQPIGLKFIEFNEYLEGLLGQKVDVLTEEGIKGIRNKEIAKNMKDSQSKSEC